jgi:DNA-directed RNA polymerase sigma subunit (sigma70/sigma32)
MIQSSHKEGMPMNTLSDKSRTQLTNLIDEWILDERGRNVIKRRMLDNITYEKLSEEFNLSVTQIKNICYKSICILASRVIE